MQGGSMNDNLTREAPTLIHIAAAKAVGLNPRNLCWSHKLLQGGTATQRAHRGPSGDIATAWTSS